MIIKILYSKFSLIKQWTRFVAILFGGITLFATNGFAQGEPENEQEEFEEVIVTGSRLARDPNLASTSPIQSVGEEEIQLSGEFSIADVVNDVPALFSSITAEGSRDNGTLSDGTNVLDLRGLGSDRTLVLVDGRRHVGGVSGNGSVDVGSIPLPLIEKVEILTGGASAIYGADAVTGVVNFIMKRDFEGLEIDFQTGRSSEGDAEKTSIAGIWGKNFADGRGNITAALDFREDKGLRVSDRSNGLQIGSARDWLNPDLRFQQGDITASSTPNFDRYYNYANTGRTNFGLPIPTSADFTANYFAEFATNPALTAAEQTLIARAANAPARAILPERTFPFTSGYGYIIPGNPYSFNGFDAETNIDLDGNGTPDCLDSFTGYNSSFGTDSFGVVGGCWNVSADGSYAPIQDGLIADDFQGFGGDSFNALRQDNEYLINPNDVTSLNLLGNFEVNEAVKFFAEVKYVTAEVENEQQPTSYWDLLFGAPDNPYLPAFIQPVATANNGVAITIDPIAIGSGRTTTERDTTRLVFGVKGTVFDDWSYEASFNKGKFNEIFTGHNAIINDRFLAAIDAVIDPSTNEPACRREVNVAAPATTTPFNIPSYDPGYYSFTPGSGQCVPLNIWSGEAGISQAAVDWITTDSISETIIDQSVFSAHLIGNTQDFFEMPAGPIDFVVGTEFRDEKSQFLTDAYQRGVIPAGAAYPAGTNIADVSTNSSLVFQPGILIQNQGGQYDVEEYFFETAIPLLKDNPGAEELSLELAARFSDYSTIGHTTTWKANLFYKPIESLTFRLSVSEAVRAPNIYELFLADDGTTYRPVDPCGATNIAGVAAGDPTTAANTQANCVEYFSSIGYDPTDGGGNYIFEDTLSAAFPGVIGGNPDLKEETADTTTLGLIFEPSFIEGFSFTLDYYEIELADAIKAVTAQDIVNACYKGSMLDDDFCNNLARDGGAGGSGNFNFLRRTEINYAKLDTAGYDFSINYDFSVGEHNFSTRLQGTRVHKLNEFSNPDDLDFINPELTEINRPKTAGNVYLGWDRGKWQVGMQSQYMSSQLLGWVEIEEQFLYGDSVMMGPVWVHNLSSTYDFSETMKFYGGIRNVTDEEPFITNVSHPTSARGRYFFFGVEARFD